MTILEWLKASTRYNFEDIIFQKIALDRGLVETDSATTLSVRDKELLMADMMFIALITSPSSTASQTALHNSFQRTIGTEQNTDEKRKSDIGIMKSIYKKYNDEKYYLIDGGTKKITFPIIEDLI
ncbi:MAG: hypothetical protein WCS17_09680 [Prevotella sp.]